MAFSNFTVNVKAFDKDVRKDLLVVQGKIAQRVQVKALNYAVKRVRTETSKSLAASKSVSSRTVLGRLKLFPASKGRPRATLLALQLRILGRHLGTPKQQKSGVKLGKHKFEGAFIATMESGKTLVVKRDGRPRLPITEVGIPLLPEVEQVIPLLMSTVGARGYVKEFERLMKVELAKKHAR